jgi:hypothetical protein
VEGVGVDEQQPPRLGEREPAAAALDQPLAELELERTDLLRDRGLRQKERSGRTGERSLVGDLTEGEEAARIEYRLILSEMNIDYLT